MADKLTTSDIVAAIMRGDADDNLQAVYNAYSQRHKILKQIKSTNVAATVKVGSHVRITGIKPKYLEGVTGKVSKVEPSRGKGYVNITADREIFMQGRMTKEITGIPMVCLEMED